MNATKPFKSWRSQAAQPPRTASWDNLRDALEMFEPGLKLKREQPGTVAHRAHRSMTTRARSG